MADPIPWKLVAPWYRWKQQGGDPRDDAGLVGTSKASAARPSIQKFETADFVNAFLKDPQRSLKFNDDDLVVEYEPVARITNSFFPAPGVFPQLVLRKEPKGGGDPIPVPPAESVAKPGSTRKLFLDTHKRFYLVVVELHCDTAGFPSTKRDEVCETGFVVRRRRQVMTPEQAKDAAKILKDVAKAAIELQASATSEKLKQLEAEYQAELDSQKGLTKQQFVKAALSSPLRKAKASALQTIATAQTKLQAWQSKVNNLLEGWVPSDFDKIGSWQVVEEEPQTITEKIFPLYPLIPDPREAKHAGTGRNIYFGVIPTGSSETEDDGTAQFDPTSHYEIRCFVRRHKKECPKTGKRNDCPGPLVWSKPTEVYRLAPHMDLIGTSHRPVTVQLPNIPELAAQAATLPPKKIAPFRMASPNPQSNMGFTPADNPKDSTPDPPGGFAQICSFAIPLLTIVAMFVLNLFLPIIVFVFGLFFLLKLKLCIPPSLEISAGVSATLDFVPPSIDIEVDFKAEFDAKFAVGSDAYVAVHGALDPGGPNWAASLRADIEDDLKARLGDDAAADYIANYSNKPLLELDAELIPPKDKPDPNELSLTESLVYEPPVLEAEVTIS